VVINTPIFGLDIPKSLVMACTPGTAILDPHVAIKPVIDTVIDIDHFCRLGQFRGLAGWVAKLARI
jgi:hypothetical protein